jgi:hypothetical protein
MPQAPLCAERPGAASNGLLVDIKLGEVVVGEGIEATARDDPGMISSRSAAGVGAWAASRAAANDPGSRESVIPLNSG